MKVLLSPRSTLQQKNTKNSTWAHSIQLPQRIFLGLGTLPWFALYFKIQTDYFKIVFKKIKKSMVMRSSLPRLFIVHLITFGVIVKIKKTARFCKHSYISFICNILLNHSAIPCIILLCLEVILSSSIDLLHSSY